MSLKYLPLLIGLLFCVISAFESLAEDLNLEPSGSRFKSYTHTLSYRYFITDWLSGSGGTARLFSLSRHFWQNAPARERRSRSPLAGVGRFLILNGWSYTFTISCFSYVPRLFPKAIPIVTIKLQPIYVFGITQVTLWVVRITRSSIFTKCSKPVLKVFHKPTIYQGSRDDEIIHVFCFYR
jgi:hypothetical protein